MTRRRDTRRFGPGPYALRFARRKSWGTGFPFDLPAMRTIDRLGLDQPERYLRAIEPAFGGQ